MSAVAPHIWFDWVLRQCALLLESLVWIMPPHPKTQGAQNHWPVSVAHHWACMHVCMLKFQLCGATVSVYVNYEMPSIQLRMRYLLLARAVLFGRGIEKQQFTYYIGDGWLSIAVLTISDKRIKCPNVFNGQTKSIWSDIIVLGPVHGMMPDIFFFFKPR